jgi:hypothetical protein
MKLCATELWECDVKDIIKLEMLWDLSVKNVEKNVCRLKNAKSLSLYFNFSENICLILHINNLAMYLSMWLFYCALKKGKAIPVTGHGGPWGCEKSRFPHFLHNWLTDGGKVVSLTLRPPFTPQEDSWYSYLLQAESTPGP